MAWTRTGGGVGPAWSETMWRFMVGLGLLLALAGLVIVALRGWRSSCRLRQYADRHRGGVPLRRHRSGGCGHRPAPSAGSLRAAGRGARGRHARQRPAGDYADEDFAPEEAACRAMMRPKTSMRTRSPRRRPCRPAPMCRRPSRASPSAPRPRRSLSPRTAAHGAAALRTRPAGFRSRCPGRAAPRRTPALRAPARRGAPGRAAAHRADRHAGSAPARTGSRPHAGRGILRRPPASQPPVPQPPSPPAPRRTTRSRPSVRWIARWSVPSNARRERTLDRPAERPPLVTRPFNPPCGRPDPIAPPAPPRRRPLRPRPPVAPPAPPAPAPAAAGEPSVLKSGVVGGMAYTLYSDGSIQAELPDGTLRFKSPAGIARPRRPLPGLKIRPAA